MVLVCCCPGCPQSQLDVEESTVTVQGTGQVRETRGLAAYECQNGYSTTALHQQRHPQIPGRLSFRPARFLLSLRSRERFCHALYVSAVLVWGLLPDARRAASLHLSCTGRPVHRELNKWLRTFALGSMSRYTVRTFHADEKVRSPVILALVCLWFPLEFTTVNLFSLVLGLSSQSGLLHVPRQLLIWMVVFSVNRCVWTLAAPRTWLRLSRRFFLSS